MQESFDSSYDFAVINHFSTVGLLDAPPNCCPEMRVLFDQTQSGIFHQLLGVCTAVAGYLGEAGFLFRSKVYLHFSIMTPSVRQPMPYKREV